ncbi:MAG: squalene--hopene cyclase [Planctomycetota bacterium]
MEEQRMTGSSSTVGSAATALSGQSPGQAALDEALSRGRAALLSKQANDGHWCYELEADCTIPAEYILMMHFVGEIDEVIERKIAVYLRARQADHGGWPLYYGGEFDISCSVKCYWALKLAGDDPEAPHMARVRRAILEHGGAARCNVFTRITMAVFGQIPWRGVPFLPVEIILLPRWFPFHLSKVSYWSRTVMLPLTILCSLKARAQNPRDIHIQELFSTPPEEERSYFPVRSRLNRVFLAIERTVRLLEPLIPRIVRRRATRKAEQWIRARLERSDGLGAIFPAMVNALESLVVLGYPPDDSDRMRCKEALERLLVVREDWAYCQPCFSPVWDTALACLALEEANAVEPSDDVRKALDAAHRWLEKEQILDGPADWRVNRPALQPGGWGFQYSNSWYADLDDTSAVGWSLVHDPVRHGEGIRRAADWVVGMQSKGGGFAAFDVDNTHSYLSEIPFADHGALLDPPTADVSARCLTFLSILGRPEDEEARRACLEYLYREQDQNGSWYGRWGTNYIYGTWAVLVGLAEIEDEAKEQCVRRATAWLKSVQCPDGSWVEGNDTYTHPERSGQGPEGTSFQTAWALLGLMAGGEGDSPAVRRGIAYLLATQGEDGTWNEPWFTAPGFPRVFFLKYHGYSHYFPLWALARYQRIVQGSRQ